MADSEIVRFPEDKPLLGKDVNRIIDAVLLGNDGAQSRRVGYSGTVKDVDTGATISTGAFTDVVQNTGGNHIAVLLAATSPSAAPTVSNSVFFVTDNGVTIGTGKEVRLYNAGGTNLVNLVHSGTNDILKTDDGLWVAGAMGVGVSPSGLAAGVIVGTTLKASVRNSANISVADNTFQTLTFDTELWDNDTIHDTAVNPGRLTCKHAGLYAIVGQVTFAANATGQRSIRVQLNGATVIVGATGGNAGAAVTTQMVVSVQYELAVNDYVEVQAFQNSGGALNVQTLGTYTPGFMMARIG